MLEARPYKRAVEEMPTMRWNLEDLKILETLLNERSLTRTAQALQLSQPAVSKTLAKLRRRFADPLFVRVGTRMEPTRRAMTLQRPAREVLLAVKGLDQPGETFDPKRSERTFRLFIGDVGTIRLFPQLMQVLQSESPGVLLQAVQADPERLHGLLEAGDVDLAVGPFPKLAQTIRRQRLFTEGYVSVARHEHPRLTLRPSAAAYCRERHVVVCGHGTTFFHHEMEKVLISALPARNVVLRVPSFVAAAMVAKHTDAVATLPSRVAAMLAVEISLQLIRPPLALPLLAIGLYWHERAHRDGGNKWLRSLFQRLFQQNGRYRTF
jgi:DNA-binding transcriptional LysR family regulator